jgi:hypothetical protein
MPTSGFTPEGADREMIWAGNSCEMRLAIHTVKHVALDGRRRGAESPG